jgi:hypothetical protein
MQQSASSIDEKLDTTQKVIWNYTRSIPEPEQITKLEESWIKKLYGRINL